MPVSFAFKIYSSLVFIRVSRALKWVLVGLLVCLLRFMDLWAYTSCVWENFSHGFFQCFSASLPPLPLF